MNVKKGIFRVVVVLSILSGLTTLIIMRGNISNEYYSEKNELISLKERELLDKISLESRWESEYGERKAEIVLVMLWPEPHPTRKEKEYIAEQARQEITFLVVITHKPIVILLPILYFLSGFLPVWVVYFMAYYIIRGFMNKNPEKQ
jgi:hypothetical protein